MKFSDSSAHGGTFTGADELVYRATFRARTIAMVISAFEACRNGITVPELEEFVYQAATYLGFPSGKALRQTIGRSIEAAS